MPHSRPTVGIRLPVWASPTTPVIRGVSRFMRNHGHWRIETLNDSYGEMEKVEITTGWQGDGLILYRATDEELADFKKRGIAVVLLSTEGPDAGYPRVLPDNAAAGRAAAKHLMGIGHDAFAYLARGETLYKEAEFISGQRVYARERLAGYKEALAENDFEPRVHMLPGLPLWKKDTWKKMERAVEEFLTELPSPAGLFVVDDALASVALRVAERTDIAVPQSLSVLGFGDDVNYCHASLPTLSSIPYPAQAVGYRAAKELARQIAGEETGDRRQETGDRRQETGDRGQETRGRRYVSLWMPYIAASRPISSPSTMLKRRCSSAGLGGPRRAPRSALRTSWSRRLTPTAP